MKDKSKFILNLNNFVFWIKVFFFSLLKRIVLFSDKVKSESYWPFDENPIYLGGAEIHLSSEKKQNDWVFRTLLVTKVKKVIKKV